MNNYNEYKKLFERDQLTIKSFDKFYRKSLHDNLIDKNEHESLCNILLNMFMKTKMSLFYNYEYKGKIELFW